MARHLRAHEASEQQTSPTASGPVASLPRWVSVLAQGLLALVLVGTLILMLCSAPQMDYACKAVFLLPNTVLLPLGMLVAGGLAWVAARQGTPPWRLSPRATDIAVVVATVALVGLSVYLARTYVYVTGWDSKRVVESAWNLARDNGFDINYYSKYPNNLLLVRIAEECMRLAIRRGADTMDAGIFYFAVLNALSLACALVSTYYVVARLTAPGWGVLAWGLCVLLVGCSPWTLILYSDGLGVAFPATMVALLVAARRHGGVVRCVCWLLFGVVAFVGYKIKPQNVFVMLAMGLLGAILVMGKLLTAKKTGVPLRARRLLASLVCLMVGLAVGSVGCTQATADLDAQLYKSMRIPMVHFLMMGLNTTNQGTYDQGDVDFSNSFVTVDERSKADLDRALERMRSLGPQGLATLFAHKQMTNYNDGSFAWGKEGSVWVDGPYAGSRLSEVRNQFYLEEGALFRPWRTFEQQVWVNTLGFCVVALLAGVVAAMRRADACECELMETRVLLTCTVLMLTAFELLFEARARYFFSSAPLYVMLAAIGVREVYLLCAAQRRARG